MRILITLIWTLCCVGVGVAMATVDVSGKTPWQHVQKLWKSEGEKKLGEAAELVDDVKKKVSTTVKDAKDKPLDRHSADERDALDKLIANRQHGSK